MKMENLDIIYEDNHILVVVKPKNIPSQEDESGDLDMLSMVKQYIKVKYNKPGNAYAGLVHRLDRPTGGLMVFAKTSKAASRLSEQIRNCEFYKKYLTVVVGSPNERTKKLEHYLKKDERTNIVKIVPQSVSGAKKAELIYNVVDVHKNYIEIELPPKVKTKINEYEDLIEVKEEEIKIQRKAIDVLSLIEVELLTGRSHQIRVQLASLKTPIYGDVKYGEIKDDNKTVNLALWAYQIGFIHPTTKNIMNFKLLPDIEQSPWDKFATSETFKG